MLLLYINNYTIILSLDLTILNNIIRIIDVCILLY